MAVHCIRASGSYIAGVSVPLDIQPVSAIFIISAYEIHLFLCPDNTSLKSRGGGFYCILHIFTYPRLKNSDFLLSILTVSLTVKVFGG